MLIFAIDPGCEKSAYVLMDSEYQILLNDKAYNDDILETLCFHCGQLGQVVIERIASYGKPVGQEVFGTCEWTGRFAQAARERGVPVDYILRMEEKMNLCHTSRARDKDIRAALIHRFARFDFKDGKGTKKKHDVFHGFADDEWAAFAVGVTWLDKRDYERRLSQAGRG